MNKYICLDLGTTTVGIARSDILGIAHPVEEFRFERGNYKKAKDHVYEVCKTSGIYNIILGLPLQIDRQEGERCESVRRFEKELLEEHPDLKITLFDESYSTLEAHERLKDSGYKEDKIKQIIDMYSAVVILEDYLKNHE